MDQELQRRVETLEAQNIAYGVALRAIIVAVFDTNFTKRQRREMVCTAIEGIYENPSLSADGHDTLQKALHEAESLFADGLPSQPRTGG